MPNSRIRPRGGPCTGQAFRPAGSRFLSLSGDAGTGQGEGPICRSQRARRTPARKPLLALLLCPWLLAVGFPAAAAPPGPVQVAPGGAYFQLPDGSPFFAVGVLGSACLIVGPPTGPNRLQWEAYFKLLRDSGVNLLRVMVDGRGRGLSADPDNWLEDHDAENPVPDCGDEFAGGCDLDGCAPAYNPVMEETLDYLFGLAEKYGIHLLINPLVPGMLFLVNGLTYPYMDTQGGPMAAEQSVRGFFVNGEVLCLLKRRFQWLVDRWGGSPYLFGWELMNEMPSFAWDPDALENITRWISVMAGHLRRIDPDHLLTISAAVPCSTADCPCLPGIGLKPQTRNLRVWNHPEYAPGDPPLDIVTYHAYNWPAWRLGGTEEIDTVGYQMLHHQALVEEVLPVLGRPRPPVLDTEEMGMDLITGSVRHGGTLAGKPWSYEKLGDHFRMSKWTYAASGGAGVPLQWPSHVRQAATGYGFQDGPEARGFWGFQYRDYLSLAVLANLTGSIDWSTFDPQPADAWIRAPGLFTMAVADAQGGRVLAWLLHHTENPLPDPVPVSFSSLKDEDHQVLWYCDRTGRVLRSDDVSGPSAVIRVPRALFDDPDPGWDWEGRHLAVLVRPWQPGFEDINPDRDADGVMDLTDNCPDRPNPGQQDREGDTVGDACDNCPDTFNRINADYDGNGVGDACQACPLGAAGQGVFFVDLEAGLNSNPGREGSPWRTLSYARENVCEGAVFRVADGQPCQTEADCDDRNPCTDQRCVEAACVYIHNSAPCDDGRACTMNDLCRDGICSGVPPDRDGDGYASGACDGGDDCMDDPSGDPRPGEHGCPECTCGQCLCDEREPEAWRAFCLRCARCNHPGAPEFPNDCWDNDCSCGGGEAGCGDLSCDSNCGTAVTAGAPTRAQLALSVLLYLLPAAWVPGWRRILGRARPRSEAAQRR